MPLPISSAFIVYINLHPASHRFQAIVD